MSIHFFSSTKIFRFFQYRDFFKKSRHWRFSSKPVFCPSPFVRMHFFDFSFFSSAGIFSKKSPVPGNPGTGKKMKKPFFARLQKKVPIGFLSFYYFRLAFSKNPIGIPTGDLQYRNNLQYRNKRVLPVSPTGFFLLGRAHFYYLGSPPRGGRFTSRPTAYVGPALPALEVVRGPCVPIAIFCFS